MPLFGASQRFSQKKKLTRPVIKLPKKVKDALQICEATESGIFKIEPGNGVCMYDRCYRFEDINYTTQDDRRKGSILLQIMDWLKAMNMQFKVTLANEQVSVENYIQEVFSPASGQEGSLLAEGMEAWINEKIAAGVRDVNKVLYLTVTCQARSYEEAKLHFSVLDTSLNRIFSMLGSRLYCLSGTQRLGVLRRMLNPDNTLPLTPPSKDDDGWKNALLPASIDQGYKDSMVLGNSRYVSVLFGHDYDQTLDDEKVLHALMELAYPMYITLDMEPVDRGTLKNKLSSAMMNNDRAIAQERSRKYKNRQPGETSYLLDKKKDELTELMDQVDSNDEQAVFLGLLVIVVADELEELWQRVDSLKEAARGQGYLLSTYNYRQLNALNTALPIGGRQVDHMRSFLTSSAVAFNPFYARDLKDTGGYIYGLNRTTKHLIRGSRKRLKNPHGFIAGHSGGGKSFFIKTTEIAQTLLCTEDDVIILDPQNEFEDTVKTYGGQYFDLTPQCSIHLNPFELPQNILKGSALEKNKQVAKKADYACAFVGAAMYNITMTQVHHTFITRAVQQMYERYLSGATPKAPTFEDLWHGLKAIRETVGTENEKILLTDMIHSLEPYVIGVYDIFAKASNLDMHNRLVGFGLKNVPESIWEPVMVTMMHFLSERVAYNQEDLVATHLIVDEAQVLCGRASSAAQLLNAVETYRKFGGIVTLAVQNLVRVLETPSLRDMFSNCAYKVFFDQSGVDAQSLAQIQEFSEAEYKSLEENLPGYGVMVWDKQVLLFDATMDRDNPLYQVFTTNFHEQAETSQDEKYRKDLMDLLSVSPMQAQKARELLGMDQKSFNALVRMAITQNRLCMSADGLLSLPGGLGENENL